MKAVKTNKNVIRRNVAGEDILIPVGDSAMEHNGLFVLTPTGAEIWDALAKETPIEEIIAGMAKDYNVDPEMVREDVERLIEKLYGLGLVTD